MRRAIRAYYEQLLTMLADRQRFENFLKSAEQKFLSIEIFLDHRKSLEARLKSIEDKIGKGFCLLAINFYDQKKDKGYRSILCSLKNLKGVEIEGIFPFVVLLFIVSFAVFLIRSIN